MEYIGIVSINPHLKSELEKWLVEIPGEFEFVDLGPPSTGDPPPLETDEQKIFRLVIYDSNFGRPLAKLREELNLGDIPWLAIGMEEHARNPHDPKINDATDLILVPLDRSVFLQKVEYLLAGSESVAPSFLYLAKADLGIELAKRVHITHLSEIGCTILAPKPVAVGVEGTLLSRIFGEGTMEPIEVRAIDSNPCFDSSMAPAGAEAREFNFEVQLRFFGLKKKQLLAMRKWLATNQPELHQEVPRSDADPAAILHAAVISPQSSLSAVFQSSLDQLAKTEVDLFAGFSRLHGELLIRAARRTKTTSMPEVAPTSALVWSKDFIGPKTVEDSIPALPQTKMILNFRMASPTAPCKIEKFSPALKPNEKMLGLRAEAWTRDASVLTQGLGESDQKAFDEGVQWALANSTLTKHPETQLTATLIVSDSMRPQVSYKISVLEAATPSRPALLKIQFEDTSESVSTSESIDHASYEVILIDGSLLTHDAKSKVTQVAEWLETFDIRNSFGNRPPIVVLNANEDLIQARDFRGTAVRQLIYEFTDRRYHAEVFISLSRPELWTSPRLMVTDHKTDLKAFLSRPARASAVSEVSLVIKDHSPLKKGTELLVMSSAWPQAPEGLWARLRSASPKDEGFENEFIFFGVSDVVQKEIRKFAREDYIKKKAQGQG